MKNLKTRAAAAATVVGLGGLAGVALSSQGRGGATTTAADRPVRTEVVRRTIHVTKHAKPRPAADVAAPAIGAAPVATAAPSAIPVSSPSTSSAAPEPIATSPSPAPSTPVVTSPSGAGGAMGAGGEEHEQEHGESDGGEGEAFDD